MGYRQLTSKLLEAVFSASVVKQGFAKHILEERQEVVVKSWEILREQARKDSVILCDRRPVVCSY